MKSGCPLPAAAHGVRVLGETPEAARAGRHVPLFQASPGRVGWTKFVNARPEAGLPTLRCLIEDKRRTLSGHFGGSSKPLRSRVGIRPASQSEPSFIEDKLRRSHAIQAEQGGRPGSVTRSRIDSTKEFLMTVPPSSSQPIFKDDSWERDQLVIM